MLESAPRLREDIQGTTTDDCSFCLPQRSRLPRFEHTTEYPQRARTLDCALEGPTELPISHVHAHHAKHTYTIITRWCGPSRAQALKPNRNRKYPHNKHHNYIHTKLSQAQCHIQCLLPRHRVHPNNHKPHPTTPTSTPPTHTSPLPPSPHHKPPAPRTLLARPTSTMNSIPTSPAQCPAAPPLTQPFTAPRLAGTSMTYTGTVNCDRVLSTGTISGFACG
jgi:hypothetical protein